MAKQDGGTVPPYDTVKTGKSIKTGSLEEEDTMLNMAVLFLILALVAGVLGFGGIAAISIELARILFAIFIILFLVTAVIYLVTGRTPPPPA